MSDSKEQEFEYYYMRVTKSLFQYSRKNGAYKYANWDFPKSPSKKELEALFINRDMFYYDQVEWDKWVESRKPVRVYPRILASTKSYM